MGSGSSTATFASESWSSHHKAEDGYKISSKDPENDDADHELETSESEESLHEEVVYIERVAKKKTSRLPPPCRLRDRMNDTGVQTEEVLDEELDWDLSDHVDRETQTLPPNPTPLQVNRTEAIVQTDCRYISLDSDGRPTTAFETEVGQIVVAKELATVGTQTEETKNSVSTQTDFQEILACPKSALERQGPEILVSGRIGSRGSLKAMKEDLQEVHRKLSLVTVDGHSSLVTSPLLPSNPSQNFDLDFNPQNDAVEGHRKDPLELWKRFTPFALDELMPAFKMATKAFKRRKRMVDVSIQTDVGLLSEESPGYAPGPPNCSKDELIQLIDISEIDLHVLTIPEEVSKDPQELIDALCVETVNDLIKTRLIFRWIAEHISYDIRCSEKDQTVEEILASRSGVAKDYVNLFLELSFLAGLKASKLTGFARGYDCKIGKIFVPENDSLHCWIAVYVFNAWRLIDPTFGSGYVDDNGRFHPVIEEHYFLTDPSEFIYTHFPYDVDEVNYDKWQLLDIPITLDDFNRTPKVSPYFFACQLRLRNHLTSPVVVSNQAEVQVAASILLRYKFRFFKADECEKEAKNEFVFCQLKEGGVVGSFRIVAPTTGMYILKVFAAPDDTPEDEDTLTPFVFAFELNIIKARRYPIPWPLHDGAWGPTPRLYECGLDPVCQPTPLITTWGGKKLMYFEKVSEVLLMMQLFDHKGQLLELKGVLKKDESEDQIRLSIVPPSIGLYKLLIYGIPKPQEKGRWRLPLLAAYLIECKMSISQHVEYLANNVKKSHKSSKSRTSASSGR